MGGPAPRYEPRDILAALKGDRRFNIDWTVPPDRPAPAGGRLVSFRPQRYDVVVVGDIPVSRFTRGDPAVLTTLRDLVKEKTGLLLLGG